MEGECKLRLSRVRIRNFINFEDVDIKVNQAHAIQFVGCNGSGKTSMFEAIRRCTESKSNHSFSTIPNRDEVSIVVCTFTGNVKKGRNGSSTTKSSSETNSNKPQDRTLSADTEDNMDVSYRSKNINGDQLMSVYLSWYNKYGIRNAIKAIIFTHNGDISSEILCTHMSASKEILWAHYNNELDKVTLEQLLKDNCSLEFIKENIICHDTSMEIKSGDKVDAEKDFDSKFCGLVKIEILYSFRGISRLQSSEQMPNLTAAEHFRDGTERSFIITQYLENEGDYDLDLEQDIFKRLTPDDDYSFHFTGEKSTRLLEVKDNRTSSTISILKTPVGVLEAKYMSITLAKKRSGIVMIEEPGRGMHPDMIRRMIYLVFQDKELMAGKMVIVTTHDKTFLTPFTIENTFLCKKRDEKVREVKPLANIDSWEARSRPTSGTELGIRKQSVGDEDKFHKRESVECRFLQAIVFSHRIMFLEGESDFTLIEAIKQLLITKKSLMKMYLRALSHEYNKDIGHNAERDLIQFLASLNVEMMNGVKNMKKINDICYYLGLQDSRFFLVDNDVLGSIDKTLSLDFSRLEWFNLDILEGNGVFVWDNDTVETTSNEDGTYNKGVQCPGVLKQDKQSGAGVPPKPGTLEDVVVRYCIQHDKEHHCRDLTCSLPECNGLVKLLEQKKIASLKNWSSFSFTTEKNIFEIEVKAYLDIDETTSCLFTEITDGYVSTSDDKVHGNIVGTITVKGENRIKICETGDINLFDRQTSESQGTKNIENAGRLYIRCEASTFSFTQDTNKRLECKDGCTITIEITNINVIQPTNKKGIAKYGGQFDIAIERNTDRETKMVKVTCVEPGTLVLDVKPPSQPTQSHKRLCMTEKFLLQTSLSHSDVLEVVEKFLECSMEYRDGQIWRFLRFLANRALNRQTKIHMKKQGGRFIQTVQVMQ